MDSQKNGKKKLSIKKPFFLLLVNLSVEKSLLTTKAKIKKSSSLYYYNRLPPYLNLHFMKCRFY